ncbi:MAG: MerR family transcriptional regulator [Proteobacteria bacterium]|nr:MerR family transcriptional regulator [Pseudomonadota bacterium]MBU1742482.1 MerR family transcriptional regulator [Pseudomonadota bacterium]
MKELAIATGLPKSTIHYYAQEGLLPEPTKTSPNMAYYHPSCVERILFIKEVQAERNLPLKAIKRLLMEKDQGREITPLLELQEVLFGRRNRHRVSTSEFRQLTELTSAQLKRVISAGVVIPMEDGRFDHKDIEIGRLIRRAIDLGLNPEQWSFLNQLGQPIIDQQLAYRYRQTKDLPFDEDTVLTKEIATFMWAVTPYILERIMQRRLIKIRGLKDPSIRPDEKTSPGRGDDGPDE